MSIRKQELEIEKMRLDRIIRKEGHEQKMERLNIKLDIVEAKKRK